MDLFLKTEFISQLSVLFYFFGILSFLKLAYQLLNRLSYLFFEGRLGIEINRR